MAVVLYHMCTYNSIYLHNFTYMHTHTHVISYLHLLLELHPPNIIRSCFSAVLLRSHVCLLSSWSQRCSILPRFILQNRGQQMDPKVVQKGRLSKSRAPSNDKFPDLSWNPVRNLAAPEWIQSDLNSQIKNSHLRVHCEWWLQRPNIPLNSILMYIKHVITYSSQFRITIHQHPYVEGCWSHQIRKGCSKVYGSGCKYRSWGVWK